MDVAIVGSGPNGLAAAVLMARAGLSVRVFEAADRLGGGLRSMPLFDGEVVHDVCSAVHPMAVAAPFFRRFDLEARGVELPSPAVSYAHPLDGGAGIAYRDLEETCERLGQDGARWRRLMAPLARRSTQLIDFFFSDQRRLPRDPVATLLLGLRTLQHGTALSRHAFCGRQAPALLAGVAAHSVGRLPSLPGGAVSLLLGHLAHTCGWPVPRGGSQRIADAMVADIERHGGTLHPGTPVTELAELGRARAVLLDVSPSVFVRIAGRLLPPHYRRQLATFRYGPAAAKVDFLVSEPIPWADPAVGQAGTVHLGGEQAEVFATETGVSRGRYPDEPFVLLAQPAVADPGRAREGKWPVWAYCHLPNGDPTDPTDLIQARIERFAPGFGDTVLARHGVPAPAMEAYNPNYVGGDIGAGAVNLRQTFLRPTPRWDPHSTPLGGVYLCSASTPPGPGVHGMSGYFAAVSALRREFGIRDLPELGPAR
ncbi:phytoene desaturase family protein [Amycolatopsis cihanbeyliensis]|uniref:Pyridine nucleotide-disulfide oxidoreductase domain-containing protein 2 n=1 Tax=Amycolatopsis cihanbeyliensis TaxID=1128664 RepID=A0A542DH55_AMYCI|nr:NAD(P)/FAD-dependent oxidoreductase [Amycolatopsis cihanbeyliensis]TQJ02423.1 phytoene dehydrogenase-like protein [Amycolatopsis cihanbeyliensis]